MYQDSESAPVNGQASAPTATPNKAVCVLYVLKIPAAYSGILCREAFGSTGTWYNTTDRIYIALYRISKPVLTRFINNQVVTHFAGTSSEVGADSYCRSLT